MKNNNFNKLSVVPSNSELIACMLSLKTYVTRMGTQFCVKLLALWMLDLLHVILKIHVFIVLW